MGVYTWAPKRKHFRITTKMLVFLSLLSLASAAPQSYFLPGYPSMTHYTPSVAHYNPYVAPYVNSYAALPRVAQVPQVAPQVVGAQDYAVVSAYPLPDARLVTFSSLQTSAGTVAFQQNPVTGQAATYKIYLAGAGILNNSKYRIGVATDCAAAGFMALQDITSPLFMFNGMHVGGATTTVNIDGAGGKTSVTGMRFVVQGPLPATTTIGCSAANLV